MNLAYVMPRMVRHFMPDAVVRSLLRRSLLIQPGIETRDATGALKRYLDVLAERRLSFKGKRVMVFGYGGRIDVAVRLLKEGAAHVFLCDRYAPPDSAHNRRQLAANQSGVLVPHAVEPPHPELITFLHGDIREETLTRNIEPVDFVISNSVFEHLDDVDGTTSALAALTRPDGVHIHFIDLRDHFFKYPFEMLRFSEYTWRHWLNPSSNHNRYRLWHFRQAFARHFGNLDVCVLSRNETEFNKVRRHIRPEFISGRTDEDDVEVILVVAKEPIGAIARETVPARLGATAPVS